MVCSDFQNLDRPLTKQQLETAHLCQEIAKLREEVRTAESANKVSSGVFGPLIAMAGVITGVLTGFAALMVPALGFLFRGSFEKSQRDKFVQERVLQREAHNLRLMEGLGSPNRAIQLASVSSLLRRIEELRLSGEAGVRDSSEYKTIADIIVSVLRDPQIDESVSKYLADEMINVFGLRSAKRGGAQARDATLLKDFNLQRTRLSNVYWADVVADGVDFFRADLSGASLRGASLNRAVLYETDLRKAVLTNARLTGANLFSADLRGARLDGADFSGATGLETATMDNATRWDAKTVWPMGFAPRIDATSA